MAFLTSFKKSIFVRIYAGLLLVCVLVAMITYVLLTAINERRVQNYREEVATAVFHLILEGLNRKSMPQEEEYWISDVSNLFEEKFRVVALKEQNFKASELRKLHNGRAIVRYDENDHTVDVFFKLNHTEKLLTVTLSRMTEKQMTSVGVLLFDELSHFPTLAEKQQRVKQLQAYFPFPLSLQSVDKLELDADQRAQLYRKDIVIMFRDNTSVENSFLRIVAPTEMVDTVVELGPIQLFNWYPLNLIISLIAICMLLISCGVYILITPLERRLQFIQVGVNRLQEGKLDTKVKVIGEDELAHLAATFNNMTEHIRRLIESQRELTRAVSHELRTPVARIRFAIDMLADADDESDRLIQRDLIDQDIEALNGLIDEILTYAKLEEGSPKMDWESVNLKQLVVQIVKETNALGKSVTVEMGKVDEKAVAVADRRYLHRVLQNLAGNATRYANQKVVVSAGIHHGEAYICVEDDGAGIPEEDREKVFIPFARLDDSRTRSSGGYGLGLSIVSRIAFWFNGRMSVDESPELKGARFIMRWPVRPLTNSIVADALVQKSSEKKYIEQSGDS